MDITVPVHGKAELNCEPGKMTRPRADVTWMVNGNPISSYLDGKRRRISKNVSF